ncbi:ribonuclease activity regulator RraA [Georgenia alba]|uniref:Putative 4-hydroxy-4-methyl-2-oxoglutarate aldolase n=1 Tax=Georgenia alba TaxID=2233858 RepID=A0ABW2Q4F5_9MICO
MHESMSIEPELRKALQRVSVATLTTQLFVRGLRSTYLSGPVPLRPDQPQMVGPAYTVRSIPAREDLDVLSVFDDYDHPQRRAIEEAPPDSVLVIDSRRDTTAASLGHILATRFEVRGGAGIVTDGSVRDVDGFRTLTMPTFADGAAPTTNLARHHVVDLNQPIACGGVAVYPGDVMVGGSDGVICIPAHLAEEIAEEALKQEQLEDFILERIRSGHPLRNNYPASTQTLEIYERERRS